MPARYAFFDLKTISDPLRGIRSISGKMFSAMLVPPFRLCRYVARASQIAMLILLVAGSIASQSQAPAAATAAPAPPPKPLIDVTAPDATKHIRQNYGDPVYTADAKGITVQLPAARANYPGIQIFPNPDDPKAVWDLSKYGHIEAKITNTGKEVIRPSLSIDGEFAGQPARNTEIMGVKPGETKVIKVIFGYAFGYKPSGKVDPSRVKQVLIFLTKATVDQSFVIQDLQAGGPPDEKPPFNPDDAVIAPPNGIILGPGVAFDISKQVVATGAKASAGPNGALEASFGGHKDEMLIIKPPMGVWDLSQANELRVRFKNIGQTPVTPSVTVGSAKSSLAAPIAPGAEAEIDASFIPPTPTLIGADWKKVTPGTGTTFENNKAKQFVIEADATPGSKTLLITSIVADGATEVVPDWVGKRPPVPGDWTETFDEEFNAPTIDLHKWNIYGHNYWDKRTHFTKDNLIIKDGNAILLYEKKHGLQNDGYGEADNGSPKETDYAVGFLNTFGKFTQRYGYFESRMKLPRTPGLWPAFWLMPDRGKNVGHYRVGTGKQAEDGNGVGGMEFDIMEFLSGWGPYRFNIAMHWDGYGRDHKSTGSELNYYKPDKDGYVTVGLLWTPGVAAYYINGRECLRWENPRISDLPEYIMYDMVSGGWSNTPFDDKKLPGELDIDWVRVWQRKDLASPVDGPKPNKGDPSEMHN
jgi:beta-glucanase (GH16 family)